MLLCLLFTILLGKVQLRLDLTNSIHVWITVTVLLAYLWLQVEGNGGERRTIWQHLDSPARTHCSFPGKHLIQLLTALASMVLCMYVCVCVYLRKKLAEGWGWYPDIPNPCKLWGLTEGVQRQSEIFVREQEECVCLFWTLDTILNCMLCVFMHVLQCNLTLDCRLVIKDLVWSLKHWAAV